MFWTRPAAARAPAPPEPKTLDVCHAGAVHRVAVKRVAAARRFTLRVRAADGAAVLTMPPRASLRSAQAFAERNAEWIGTRLAALPERIAFRPGTSVPLRGTDHVIALDPTSLRRVQPGLGPDGTPVLRVSPRAPDPAGAVLHFLAAEARADLAAAVARHAAAVGRPVAGITLRDTRSRWGSCSSRGALNFSWRLILAPPVVLDYLAAHEVAHLVHMDHSEDFWRVTRRLAPRTDEAEAWLKRHGPGLHRYGPGR
ncbi:M48 family peptidase [Lichenibacterium minor]|uniref:M48 family peptidase n=1 Tax=Lichenibacterium minor TaxID=2316528 RepID=A0A4Q2UBW7_9HYPH|nr:SprT family zinc-dependent metalloprotease [Lichenibacterium minor]RYC32355.1 M48 family peptidase [Lichenibacterium minor]